MTAPANNNFADATILTGALPITLTGETNVDATTEVDEPLGIAYGAVDPADDYAGMDPTVWYAWTCGTTDTYRFRVDADHPIALTVYTGGTAFADLERIDQSEMIWSEPHFESVYFDGTASQTYYFQMAGYEGWTGEFDLELSTFVRPANDNFADAQEITSLPAIISSSNYGATTEPDEPRAIVVYGGRDYYQDAKSVWYRYVAPASTTIVTVARTGRWSEYGEGGLLRLQFFTGESLAELVDEGSVDQYAGSEPLTTYLTGDGSTPYYIRITADPSDRNYEGEFTLELIGPPANDTWASAAPITLTGGSATVSGNSAFASTEAGEPLTFAPFGFSGTITDTVWWSFEPDADGLATFDTFGSDFDTTAAVFTGGSLSGLTTVAFNDDYAGGSVTIPQSQVAWDAEGGETYFIQVGAASQGGSVSGHLYFSAYPAGDPPPPPPPLTVQDPYRIELRTLNSAGFTVTTESLELTTFSCNWRLNAPGAFDGAGVIGTTQADAANVGARELIVYKGTGEDETAIWGGYLTFFDVDEDTKRIRVGAEGYWSRARSRLMRGNQIYKPITNSGVPWKANVIAWDIIDQAQGASYGDMGWAYGGHSGTRKDCKRIYYGVDRNNVGEAIEALAREGFFDFAVDVHPTPTSGTVATFRTWYERGTNRTGSINLSASNAMTLNYSVSSSDMATVIDVFGSVEGCRGVASTETSNLATYGRVEARPIDMETDEQAEVDSTAARFIAQHSVPAKNAVATYMEGVGPDLTDYDLGDTIRVSPADGYVSNFDGRVVGRELAVEAGRAVITVEVER